jgi:hypothetical protein
MQGTKRLFGSVRCSLTERLTTGRPQVNKRIANPIAAELSPQPCIRKLAVRTLLLSGWGMVFDVAAIALGQYTISAGLRALRTPSLCGVRWF